MATWLQCKVISYLLQRNSSKSSDATAKRVVILQGVLANGMDDCSPVCGDSKGQSCSNAMKPELMDDVLDDD